MGLCVFEVVQAMSLGYLVVFALAVKCPQCVWIQLAQERSVMELDHVVSSRVPLWEFGWRGELSLPCVRVSILGTVKGRRIVSGGWSSGAQTVW